jgi:hypothetical protein
VREKKKTFYGRKRTLEDNIKADLKEIGYKELKWIRVAQDKVDVSLL